MHRQLYGLEEWHCVCDLVMKYVWHRDRWILWFSVTGSGAWVDVEIFRPDDSNMSDRLRVPYGNIPTARAQLLVWMVEYASDPLV
jgi:hypothetical protein